MMISYTVALCATVLLLALKQTVSFAPPGRRAAFRGIGLVMMGRAANVRAATKARTDAAKAKNNGRYAKKIIVAVKAGGAHPDSNRLLAQVIADAKVANVPKEIITRNIEKASLLTSADYKESLFEFYGPGSVGLLVSVLTDNDNRASSDVNLVAKKHAIKHAAMNSVKFKFVTKARLDVNALLDDDMLMELCLENGIDDYTLHVAADGGNLSPSEEGKSAVYVQPSDMAPMRDALLAKKHSAECRLVSIPVDGFVSLSDADYEANMAAIDAFNALDDVDQVEHNIDLS
jgi:YebC/PmpR family DNA-binding regulatory protein